jgi:hypothetical protein
MSATAPPSQQAMVLKQQQRYSLPGVVRIASLLAAPRTSSKTTRSHIEAEAADGREPPKLLCGTVPFNVEPLKSSRAPLASEHRWC